MHDDQGLWHFVTSIPPFVQGAILSFAISVLSALYEDKEPNWLQVISGGLICGGITLSLWGLNKYLGLPDAIGVFAGGAVGFIGVKPLKRLLLKFLNAHAQK